MLHKTRENIKLNNSLIMDAYTLIIDSPIELEAEMCRYNSHTREELEEILKQEYNASLVLNFKI